MQREIERPRRARRRLVLVGASAALGLLAAAPAAWSELSSATAKKPTQPILKVIARIRAFQGGAGSNLTPVRIYFTPAVVNRGTVIIVARNNDEDGWHQLSINGVSTKWMGPGSGTAVIKVTFKRPGKYLAGVNVDDGETDGTGILKVIP
ncbi:MAG TPA: hypothetical protein VFA88_04970 [Gaiellaceae bacterium]|nr:hypothetical protein [Gaiellaceae bacterium]